MCVEKSSNSEVKSLISVITVCFNSSATIEDTIRSVEAQRYSNVEYLVIDGASIDSTMKIVRQHASIKHVISEPDEGIYDAMNKGISLAQGEIIGMLNADDLYEDDEVLSKVAEVFLDASIDACYADLVYVKQQDTNIIVRYWKSKKFQPGLFKNGWMPAHPTFFVRKSVYERLGGFDLNYKIAADFELLFRFIEQHKIKTKYLPRVLVKMRLGGTTNKNLSNVLKQNKEIIAILEKHYLNFSILKYFFSKLFTRLLQFVSRPIIR